MRLLLRRGLVCRPPGLARGCLALAQGGAYVVKRGWLALEIGFAVGALAPTLSYVAPPRSRPAALLLPGRRAHLAGSPACAALLWPLRAPRASRCLLPPLRPRPGSPRASCVVGLRGTDDVGGPRGCGTPLFLASRASAAGRRAERGRRIDLRLLWCLASRAWWPGAVAPAAVVGHSGCASTGVMEAVLFLAKSWTRCWDGGRR